MMRRLQSRLRRWKIFSGSNLPAAGLLYGLVRVGRWLRLSVFLSIV